MSDASQDAGAAGPAPSGRRLLWPGGLSARLLILTVLIALAAALLILVPSLADYQQSGYLDRVRAAELASLAVDVAPNRTVSKTIKTQLLQAAGDGDARGRIVRIGAEALHGRGQPLDRRHQEGVQRQIEARSRHHPDEQGLSLIHI